MSIVPTRWQTPRLLLCPYRPEDVPALFAFMGDAVAMRHTYAAPSLAHCANRLETYESQRDRFGFAPWVVRRLDSGEVVGWGGLSVDPDEPQWGLEVSYAFAPSAWGQGLASELVRASLAWAFEVLSAPEVQAFARPENEASVRVLRRCGFRYLRHEPALDRGHFVAVASDFPAASGPA